MRFCEPPALRDAGPSAYKGGLLKFSLTLISLLAMSVSAHSQEFLFYLGTRTIDKRSPGIWRGVLDAESGTLRDVRQAAEARNAGFLALSPDGKFLYSAMGEEDGKIDAFRREADGSLSPLNSQSSNGRVPCHIRTDPTGKNLLAANYTSGCISIIRIEDDGSLGERTEHRIFEGSGPDPKRQRQPHAHGIYTDPENRFVYVCDLGTDKVRIFQFDPAHGKLSPSTTESAMTPPGSGPRHLAFHPTKPIICVTNEMGLSVTSFSRDPETGALTPLGTEPTLPGDASREGATTSEIAFHPNGRWLYVSNRGHDSVALLKCDEKGSLTFVDTFPAQVRTPRGFAIDPTGRWLITAGQDDNRIAVLRIDPETGHLSRTDQSIEVPGPIHVLFAP